MGEGEGASAETQANDLGSRQKENRGGTASTVGEGEGGEEKVGRSEPTQPITRIVLNRCCSEDHRQLCCLSSMPRGEASVPVHSCGGRPLPPSRVWLVRLLRSRFLACLPSTTQQ